MRTTNPNVVLSTPCLKHHHAKVDELLSTDILPTTFSFHTFMLHMSSMLPNPPRRAPHRHQPYVVANETHAGLSALKVPSLVSLSEVPEVLANAIITSLTNASMTLNMWDIDGWSRHTISRPLAWPHPPHPTPRPQVLENVTYAEISASKVPSLVSLDDAPEVLTDAVITSLDDAMMTVNMRDDDALSDVGKNALSAMLLPVRIDQKWGLQWSKRLVKRRAVPVLLQALAFLGARDTDQATLVAGKLLLLVFVAEGRG